MKKLEFKVLLPNVITLTGLSFGLSSIRFAIELDFNLAIVCILFAGVCDVLDGMLARHLQSQSDLGAQLDSLSDFLSFGIAPAIVVFLWSKSLIYESSWAIVIFYAICSSSRLAKFNLSNFENNSDLKKIRFFSGISTPAAAGLTLLPMMIYFRFGNELLLNEILIRFYLFIPAILMISKIPTYSLKGVKFEKKSIPYLIIILASFLSLLLTDFWLAMIIIIIIYFSSIPFAVYEFKKN